MYFVHISCPPPSPPHRPPNRKGRVNDTSFILSSEPKGAPQIHFLVLMKWSPQVFHVIGGRNQLLTPRMWPDHRRTPGFPCCLTTSKTDPCWCWETSSPPSPLHTPGKWRLSPSRAPAPDAGMPPSSPNSRGDRTVHPASVKEALSENAPFYHP